MTLVDEIRKHGTSNPFWTFGGGTVLMLRHGHRVSKDVDKRADDRDPFEKHPASALRAAHADARSIRSVRRPRDATRRPAGSGETAIAHGIRPC
ncbi:nucleotidyl transferase AbiEii/AbiGii toxin family protein [Burkholderia cepacia]|uniref:nucleotidyl transferase AbiEii/AbiGii toxin family protein n=1 Tax=Burkholderia cepacia TaxID=292 RepID=UPI001E5718BA|nr:nucleotidyl transferase AbiEii/AbiGii toxin family protein [Burkholderia cepacia]MCE4127839.1 nucleotidyl transferase AbiEii/AbiGii toxin family protein [Burkholderia cepacia]